jgi:hypothetical protein
MEFHKIATRAPVQGTGGSSGKESNPIIRFKPKNQIHPGVKLSHRGEFVP